MKRLSKAEIKAAVDKLKDATPGHGEPSFVAPPLQEKKTNKNRIRKQGV